MLAIGLAVLVRARAESRGVRIAQQLAETERLADAGEFAAAFALAGELERVSPANAALARLWAKISVAAPIRSDPPGARVYRRQINARSEEWELVGTTPPVEIVKLDPESVLPATMVRIPGFTEEGVKYADYFMDRYEVSNREYKAFVDAGGYGNRTYWTHPILKAGTELAWD